MHNAKLKTLYIYQLLHDKTDNQHRLSTQQIIDELAKKGIQSERKSIYVDVEALRNIGVDIGSVCGHYAGYYLASRKFTETEINMLIDAVNAARFIPKEKSEHLISQLKSMLSEWQVDNIGSQIYIDSAGKYKYEKVNDAIDVIKEALRTNKKVKFNYRQREVDKKNIKIFSQKIHVVSPYAMIWTDGHYYLVCNRDGSDGLMNFRIEKIRNIELAYEKARNMSEVCEYTNEFDSADYISKNFSMFSAENIDIKLLCDDSIIEDIVDKFGKGIDITETDDSHFVTDVKATDNDRLVSWIMQYGGKIKVISPESIANKIKDKSQSILGLYD